MDDRPMMSIRCIRAQNVVVRRGRAARRCAGMTLIELLLGLAVTGLIGAAIASMLSAVSYGTSSNTDMRGLVVTSKAVSARFTAAVRQSRMVLDHGGSHIILWTADTDGDGQPGTREIQRIEHESDNDALVSYRATDDATDSAYELDDDFDAITTALKGNDDFVKRTWASDVTAWSSTLDAADAQKASLVSYRMTLSTGTLDEVAINAASLRN